MVKKILPILVIFSVWFIFSFPVFFQNKIAYPSDFQVNHYSLWNQYDKFWGPVKNPAMPDVVGQIYPWKKFTIESLKNKEIPFWDPYTFSGTPHMANYQSAVFSPTNIFYFIFNFENAWSFNVIIQPLLAGIFMYFFAKSLRISNYASVLSSVSFMFCGFITTWMNYTTLSLAISFLPLALFSVEKYLIKNNIFWLILLSIAISLSLFSGHFQTSLYLGIFIYAYIIFKSFLNKNLSNFIYLNIFYFSGILLASPQILSTIEFYLNAPRSSNFEKINPMPINHLPLIIAPDFYGNPVTRNNFSLIYAEFSLFSGTIPFFLAIFTFFSKNITALFFIITAITSLILGLNTPIADLIVNLQIPVISTSSLTRIYVVFSFSIAILAGIGLDFLVLNLKEKNVKKIGYWIIVCLAILASIWIFLLARMIEPDYYSIAMKNLLLPSGLLIALLILVLLGFKKSLLKVVMVLIILLTIFDMLRFSTKWQPFASKEFVFTDTTIIQELKSLDSTYRFYAPFSAEGGVYYNIPLVEGYNPLYINRYAQFVSSAKDGEIKPTERYTVSLPLNSEYLEKTVDLLSVKYVLTKKSDLGQSWVFPLNKFPENKFTKIYEDEHFIIHENKEVIDRAYLINDHIIEKNDQKIINKLFADNFNLRNSAILEKDPELKSIKASGSAKILNESPNKILIKTNTLNETLLVLTDNFYPGWKARVNGEEKEILRANYTFRAIKVPEGESTVEFYFDSKAFKYGVYISLITLLIIFSISAGKWYTTKKKGAKNARRKKRT
jgi:hypothetical protein